MAAPCRWTRNLFSSSLRVNLNVTAVNSNVVIGQSFRCCVFNQQRVNLLLSHSRIRYLCGVYSFPGLLNLKQINNGVSSRFLPTDYKFYRRGTLSSVCHYCSDKANKKRRIFDQEVRENIMTIPNLLTVSRIMLTPLIGYLVVQESFPIALGIFTFAGVTDLLDGWIARNIKGQRSTLGTVLDPLADKVLMTVLTVTLAMADLLPVPLAVLIIGRDMLLVLTGFVIRYISLPPPRTFSRYFDVTNPTAQLIPSTLSKINTALQLGLVCFTLAAPVFDYVNHPALQCLWFVTAATTFGSGIDYIINRRKAVKFLKKGRELST